MKFSFKSFFSINPASLTICSVLLVVILFWVGTPILDLIELKTYDLRFLSRGRLQPTNAVVMAVIDEKSLDTEGRWPWPRTKLATLVDILSKDGAKVIAFDIGFLEPDENSELGFINKFGKEIHNLDIRNDKLADFITASRKNADNDLALAKAIKNSSATVVLGYFFHMREADLEYQIDQKEIDRQLHRISPSKYPFIIYEDPDMQPLPFIKAYAPESNLEIFSQATDASGFFSVAADPDGVVRWMPLIIQCGEDLFPALALSCVYNYFDRPQLMVRVASYGVEGIQIGGGFIPTDESGQILINYLGPPKTFHHISISDILHGKVARGTFQDKIVLVGATAMGTHDLRATPFSPLYPGIEIHATVIDNILTQDFLTKPKWSRIYDLLAIILLGAITGIALPRLGALKGLLLATGLFFLHIFIARWLFVHTNVWLNVVYPLLAVAITYTALTVYHYMTEERERKKIKGAFRHYVAPIVIDEMLKEPGRLKLGGEEKILTVLFCDLQGFTGYSERFTPHEMIAMLSDYFEKMTEQVFAYQGTLKEYVGDEMMAIFGAPLEQTDHAQRACSAALAMRDRLNKLRAEWASMGRPPLRARTGVNSGPMLVGNLGSQYRFAYGALGDHVNLGSRLEGLNKAYGTEILIGENTAQLVEDSFFLREVDQVRVKGRVQPVQIYELVGNSGDSLPKEMKQAFSHFAAGLEAYRQQHWQEAIELFTQCLTLLPEDGPARTMAERCQIYQQTPPPTDWDGVFTMTTKE
ncbi:MAG: adenylate/guanylate cyclase domain-containing protein [Deltaproteobacteria bacterium]|nr:adenylate/guanylate cyclase domain-containing protein [Deltaproteobacteria bacterium]